MAVSPVARACTLPVLLSIAVALGTPSVVRGDLLYSASLRNGDYGGGFIVDTFTSCTDPDGSSCGDGNLGEIGITNSPDGVTYTNQNAVINFSVGRDFASKLTGFRVRGTVAFWFRASRTGHALGQTIIDNYGFNQFNSGQGSFGAGLSRNPMGTPADTTDDMVQVGWSTWHSNVWYSHTTAQTPVLTTYDEWHHVGFVWGGPSHDFEIWVDGVLRAHNTLPAGVTKSWGSSAGFGSGYNFALGEIHERVNGNSTVYGVTFRDLTIWDEARPNGDFPQAPLPTITSIVPSSGPTTGGTTVRITGTEFFHNPTVTIGGANAAVTSSQPNELIVTTPPGVEGARDVVVTTFEGSVTATGGFTYNAAAKVGDLGPGGEGGAGTLQPSLSHDGRYLAFVSTSNTFVPNDTNQAADVFVRDRATGAVVRVSLASDGAQGNGPSERPRISASGRFVAFVSSATNLVDADTNDVADVFVHDRDTDADGAFDEPAATATFRVSVASSGEQADGPSGSPDLSPEGLHVAFVSFASNLVAGDTNDADDVFLHHWPSGQTVRVSVATGGGQANGPSRAPSLSAGAARIAFASDATNLVASDGNARRDVFLHDRTDATTVRVSRTLPSQGVVDSASGGDANGDSDSPSIDDSGNILAFQTLATDIVGGMSTAVWQIVMFTLPAQGGVTAQSSRVAAPVVDIGAALRNLLSGNAQGQAGNAASTDPQVAGGGGAVAFGSEATDLVSGDSNGQQDVFVTAVTGPGQASPPQRVSLDASGNQATGASQSPAISGNGRVTSFESSAGLTPGTQGSTTTNVFVRGGQLLIARILPASAEVNATTGAVIEGSGFGTAVQVRFGTLAPTGVSRESDSRIVVGQLPAVTSPSVLDVSVTNTADGETATLASAFTFTAPAGSTTDADGDGLPDAWESAYGLNPHSATGADGASGDVDGDGLANSSEFQGDTHPKGLYARYLAEGATGGLFTTRIALANTSPSMPATALLRFQKASGTETTHRVTVPPLESRAVEVNAVAGMASAEFATLVESDSSLVVDRAMIWDKTGYGSHAERALKSADTSWYLAEGATHSGFDLFYLLQNPSPTTAAQVRIRYLLPAGGPLVKTYTVNPASRFNVWVDWEQFPDGSGNLALANTDVSAVIEVINGVPIIVERAMYLTRGGQTFAAGHESAGVNAPALNWFLAEGATGETFDLFLLFANPNATEATARVTYLLEDGRTFTRTLAVAGNSRQNIWVDFDTPDGTTGFPLANAAVSTKVEVTNGVPIIVERAMWWPRSVVEWTEAHNSPGSTVTGTAWGLAGGAVSGSPANVTTYVLIANTSAQVADARVTLLFEGAPAVSRDFLGIAPNSRRTLNIGGEFPEAAGRAFGVLVESLGTSPASLVVEGAVYQDAAGVQWAAGSNQLATRLR
jgi:hypothetical protein